MNDSDIVEALQHMVGEYKDGLSVQELQPMLFEHFMLKLSYKEIEQALLRHSGLFSEIDWKWVLRQYV